ncbi:MAG: hypothetical protein IID00_07015 [Chloroflexi bacterium]|nr:hypothetical protein [Chloroflexota bacterium]
MDLGIVVVVGPGQYSPGAQNIHRDTVFFDVFGDGLAEAFQGGLNPVNKSLIVVWATWLDPDDPTKGPYSVNWHFVVQE